MGEITPFPSPGPAYSEPSPLGPEHDLAAFDCGKVPLNDWLRGRALKAEGRTARCYVVNHNGSVVAYYSLATGAVAHEGLPAKLRQNKPDPIPVVVIGRLAVDQTHQGKGLGKALLKDALARIGTASEIVGVRAVVVHAIDLEVVPFYVSWGFKPLPTNAQTLFLPLSHIAAAV